MGQPPFIPLIGNVCVALAAFVLLLPLRAVIRDYARLYLSDDRWTRPVLLRLIPMWLLLMGALLCMTAGGGFDTLPLGRPVLHALAVAASGALALLHFVFIALYIRPGMMPRAIFAPAMYLTPISTGLLVVLSLNQASGPAPTTWLSWPWMMFVALGLVGGAGFLGHRCVHAIRAALTHLARRLANARDGAPEDQARIAALDPRSDFGFSELLGLASAYRPRQTREAATARLRSIPDFTARLAAVLEGARAHAAGLEFLHGAALAPEETRRLAIPARTALERFIREVPAPNYITRQRQKQLLKWGRRTFPVIIGKFSSTDVDFSKVMLALEEALRPDDSRR